MTETETAVLKQTALHALHVGAGARMVPFAGYDMPVQFAGVKEEHLWTRSAAGLFDVSHMGPCVLSLNASDLTGDEAHAAIAAKIEQLVPSDIASLKPGQARLTVLLTPEGGIYDDLIITRPKADADQGKLYVVVNGAVKEQDFALFSETFGETVNLHRLDTSHVLIALQGPEAEAVLSAYFPSISDLKFMRSELTLDAAHIQAVSRCGYTGEDGFELVLPQAEGVALCEKLLSDPRVKPIGLGARDSLRLEAGLCLYGQDMDTTRTPVEADLAWVIQKSRRARADFPGAATILAALDAGPAQKRVGIQPLERAPARPGTVIEVEGTEIGVITSGGFGPSVDRPIAMGYVRADLAKPGTPIQLMIRRKARPAEVCALPFIDANYKR